MQDKKKFLVVSIYNNKKTLKDNLLLSLSKQNKQFFNIKFIQNYQGKSIPYILNFKINNIKEEYILICHQDVQLLEKNFFQKLNNFLIKAKNNFGIVGFIGIGEDYQNYGKIIDRDSYFNQNSKFKNIKVLDECCFLIKKSFLNEIGLNQNLSLHHLYCADLCIRSNILGFKNYCSNLLIRHNSKGKLIKNFFHDLKKLEKIYSIKNVSYVWKFHNLDKGGFKYLRQNFLLRRAFKTVLSIISKITFFKYVKKIVILDKTFNSIFSNHKTTKFTNSIKEFSDKEIIITNSLPETIVDEVYSYEKIKNDSYYLYAKNNNFYIYKKINLLIITKNSIISPSAKDRILKMKDYFEKKYIVRSISFTSEYTDLIKYESVFLTIFSYLRDYIYKTVLIINSIKKSDVIFIQFVITPLLLPICEIFLYIFYRNKIIIYDADDLNYKRINTYKIQLINYLKMHTLGVNLILKMSNANTYGNKNLFKISPNGNNYLNLSPRYSSQIRKKINKKIFIGYIAFKKTFENLNYISLALTNVLNLFDNVELIIIGAEKKYIVHKNCKYWKYNKITERKFYNKIHIGLNPLEDNEINRYKSAGKLISYYNHNCLGISSSVGICNEVSKMNNGVLINKLDNYNWQKKLMSILKDKKKLQNYLQNNNFKHYTDEMYSNKLNSIMQKLIRKNF